MKLYRLCQAKVLQILQKHLGYGSLTARLLIATRSEEARYLNFLAPPFGRSPLITFT